MYNQNDMMNSFMMGMLFGFLLSLILFSTIGVINERTTRI